MKKSLKIMLSGIAAQKCPCCGQGNIFEKSRPFTFQIPKMKDKCEECGYYFEREPGYFLGAMYVSYGLAVFQGILTFLLIHFLLSGTPTLGVYAIVISVIFLFAFWNYKLARVIWMYIFPN